LSLRGQKSQQNGMYGQDGYEALT